MITAVFTDNDDYAHAYGLWQWDYGQQLRIEGLHLPTAVEIHFALQETGGEAIPRVGTTKDGVTTVTIPDSMLEGNRATWMADKAYNIYAWVYLSDKSSGETIKRITMQVKSRPKPKAFEAPGDGEIFRQAIEAVNDAANRAEDAGDKAVSAADEAKAAATQTAEHLQAVQKLSEQVEINADTVAQDKQTVAGMLSQTQQAASDAALSAQEAKLSETAAVQAQAGAEAAEDGARQYAEETGADRQAVANDKQTVTQMREAVAADRQAVEQTALQFGQTSQDALTAIGQAQGTAVGAVKAEGNKQTTAVQEAGAQAVSEVAEAKTTAVQAVTTEGDKQTKRVEDAAAGIVADREQIGQNKTDIAGLVEGMTDLAPAIHNTASGSVITADDAAEGRPFWGIRVFGRTEQVRTTGKNLLDLDRYFALGYDKYYNTIANLKNGTITVTNQNDGNGQISLKRFSELKIEAPFTLSAKVNKGNCYLQVIEVTNEGQHAMIYNVTNTTKSVRVSRKDNIVDYFMRLSTNVGNSEFEVSDIQIESGETATAYEPYTGGKPSPSPEYPQDITDAGKDGSIEVKVGERNLFDGKFESGSIRQDNGENQDYADRIRTAGFIQIKPSTVYSIKLLETISFSVRWYDKDKKFIKSEATNTISQSPDNARYMRFLLLTTKLDTKCMVYAGSAPTPYEPYRDPQTLTLATPNGLPGIPVTKDGNYTDADGQQWVCDEIDLERGKYVQRVAEKDIYESQNTWGGQGTWGNIDNYNTLGFYSYINGTNGEKNWERLPIYNGMCNYLCLIADAYMKSIIGFTMGDYIAVRVPRELLPDWDENNPSAEPWINWLKARKEAGNPVIVRYALKTPIERDLTPEEIAAYKALRTYGPTTVITNDAGAGMEATYVADTGKYIQNLEERLNAKMVNIQSALISQKTSGGGHLTIADSSPLPVEEFGMTGKTEQRKMSGKNLFDINSLKKYEVDNNDLKTSVDNDKIVLEGKGVTTTEVIFFCLNKTDDLLKLNPGKYTLSFKSNMPMGTAHKSKTVEAFAIIKKADGSSDYSSTGNKGWTTFDIAEGDMMYFRFDINNGTMTAEFYDIQLEYGSSVTAYEPYTGGQPSPSPDYPQSIELADQPITVTIKGGTESQSIILTPPRPFTKWDKLEKVNGVWCWVYQHKVLSGTEMAKNSSGLHTSGALMVNVSGLGIAENQDNSVCNKLICPTKSVASLAYGEFRILYGNIYLKIDGVTTIEEGRQWLESNDIIIIAQASAPEYIPLAASEQAQLNALTMYAGTTEITNNGGCTMDLTYTADTKTYIDNKLAAISAAMIGGT